MELNRAGNPLQIYWDFNVKKSDGIVEAFPLEGKPLRLTLITPRGKKEIKDFKAHGNVIEWLFSAQYQTTYGDHSLLLEVLSPTGKVLSASDQCKFIRIVDKSCMSSDNDMVVDGETKTLTLSTEMSVVRVMPVYPEIGANGNWWIDGVDTGKPSRGEKGEDGKDGEGGGSIDPELLEGYMPLSRDFSDDFNNDFSR